MLRFTPLLLLCLLALLLPGAASARYDVRVGVGDQNVVLFDQPLFQAAKVKRVRYFIPWNAARHPAVLREARTYVREAYRQGVSVMVHISTDDLRVRRGTLPTPRAYRRYVGQIVRTLRPMGVREWGVWNEANHASQPTWNHPRRAAQYYVQMRRICRGCTIVALDVLDQRNVKRYIDRFYRAVPRSIRRQARYVGIHNYSDVNRRRSTGTRDIMRAVRHHVRSPRFWLTETGGVVRLGSSFPCSERRAANRMNYLFALMKKYRTQLDRAYIYNWFGTDCTTRMDTGVVNADGSHRASYTALRRGMARFKR